MEDVDPDGAITFFQLWSFALQSHGPQALIRGACCGAPRAEGPHWCGEKGMVSDRSGAIVNVREG